ncbi:MAG: DUF2382 domain-containing protein [Rhizonema sp. PD37]|nr:DUF2382 domain-containing protein [Rhizonema sp. PD37]
MNNKTIVQEKYSGTQSDRISTVLENLRKKVKNFVVVDNHGQLVGEVRDLIIDANRQLNIVVSRIVNHGSNGLYRLSSKLVKKIDPQIQRIFLNIDNSQVQDLPEYKETESTDEVMEQNLTDMEHYPDNFPELPLVIENNSEVESGDENKVEEEIIRLLGERLVVERNKRKVGEVIVRKEIETRMIQVPVRREKLIVEQVSPEHKQLAEIDLGEEEISGLALTPEETHQAASLDGSLTVTGEFQSPKIASLLLNAIALERNHKCKKVRVTIVVEDEERQKTYQEWFNRTSTKG